MPLYQRNPSREIGLREREACSKHLLVKAFDQVARETHLEAASLTTIQTSDMARRCILQAF